jgi:hypothetical protein
MAGRAQRVWCVGIALAAVAWLARPAAALTPESPEVQQAIRNGLKFLESAAAEDGRAGARALVGLALLKNGAEPKHPKIVAAAETIQRTLGKLDPAQVNLDIYSSGLAIIFLVTLDPSKYRPEIECLLEYLRLKQKPHGGWGYTDRETGDTSMTQYAVLSSWEAAQAGFIVEPQVIEAVATWLLKTQDPGGGFGYQGKVSDTFHPVAQAGVKQSMTAAGLGSVYICADLLGLGPRVERRRDGLPLALKEIKPKAEGPKDDLPKTRLEARQFREVQSRGNQWLRAHDDIEPNSWTHYYLYALERCSSFREVAEGRVEKEPRWYSDGARLLIRSQNRDGSWESKAKPTADTAFAVLFLSRSTKKSIEKARNYGAGTMIVGQGLPQQTDKIEVRMGRVVRQSGRSAAEEVVALLDQPEHADFDRALDALTELPQAEVEALVGKFGAKLRQLAAHRSASARLAAVRAFARVRNLDHAPTLIRALADADPQVAREAREGLQRLSRGSAAGNAAREPAAEIQHWRAWYLAVRPEAEFDL